MKGQRPRISAHRSKTGLLAVVVLAVTLGGCAANTDRADNSYSTQGKHESDDDVVDDRPPTARTLYAMARILAARGRDGESLFVLNRIIFEYQRFMPAYIDLAQLHLRHRRYDEAIAALSAGLDVSPNDPILLNNLGICWMLQGTDHEALSMFTRAAGLVPQHTRYRANMATSLGMMGRYQESLSLYKQVVATEDARHNLSVLCGIRNDGTRTCEELLLAGANRGLESDASAPSAEESP